MSKQGYQMTGKTTQHTTADKLLPETEFRYKGKDYLAKAVTHLEDGKVVTQVQDGSTVVMQASDKVEAHINVNQLESSHG